MEPLLILLFVLGIFLSLSIGVVIYNDYTAPEMHNNVHNLLGTPKVSILIPARNEQNNIEDCIRSLIDQNYNNYELLILDDNSKDNTADIIKAFAAKNVNIKLIEGKKLPKGWLGKNWACHQLSESARGEFFLFIDADVRLKENALNAAIYNMQISKCDLLSVFPTQKMKSFGEYLVVPLVNWLLLSFLPLRKVFESRNPLLAAANGQFMLFTSKAYNKLGGHQSVKNEIVEDMAFAGLAKKKGLKLLTLLGGSAVECRMYRSFDEAFQGFTKNFFPGFKTSAFNFSLLLLGIFSIYLLPIILSFINYNFLWLTLAIVVNRLLISFRSLQSPLIGIIHPIQMIILLLIGISSMNATFTGKLEWKDRKIN